MNRNSNFVRKAVLIGVIVALLIPLSIVARPASRRGDDNRIDSGGILATQRIAYDLSQAKMGEVDPASETMKLASLGFRSIAATSLWLSSIDAQEKKDWDRLAATTNTLIKIQPNFTKVWEYLAHNLSYNTSVEFDDYEERYNWVKKGLDLLTEGMGYNRLNHKFTDHLGWFTGHKLGTSDEKVEYRRLFRSDDDYHTQLDKYFDRSTYDDKYYGKDNWLLAYQWYKRSEDMVDVGIDGEKAQRYISDLMFYMHCPTQLRLHTTGLQAEYPPEEIFKVKWENASKAWQEFGARQLRNLAGVSYALEGLAEVENDLVEARQQLDALAPAGRREAMLEKVFNDLDAPAQARELLRTPPDVLTESQLMEVRELRKFLEDMTVGIDEQIYSEVAPADRDAADKLMARIYRAKEVLRAVDTNRHTANYAFWKQRNEVEQSDAALEANGHVYEAEDKGRQSIYADYVPLDKETLRPQRTADGSPVSALGSIGEYEASFEFWANQAKEKPILTNSAFFETIFENGGKVADMLKELGLPWPENFPLQEMIDKDEGTAKRHRMPTSQELKSQEAAAGIPELPSIEF